ncbi:hypothetical protein KKF69_03915 [Patescibacteria group bacterium]|nr:hypothetical protein [Patescibacteria group bacterium]
MTMSFSPQPQNVRFTYSLGKSGENKVTILADYAVQSEEIEVEKALEAKKRAEDILKKTKEKVSDRDFALAQAELRRAVMELHVANRRRRVRSSIPQK